MKNDSNMLVISGKKIKSNENDVKSGQQVKKKKLTRKEKNRLEKVIERKNKSSRVKYFELFKKIVV
jgi:hypothetical protein